MIGEEKPVAVKQYVNTSYDIVKKVYNNLTFIKSLCNNYPTNEPTGYGSYIVSAQHPCGILNIGSKSSGLTVPVGVIPTAHQLAVNAIVLESETIPDAPLYGRAIEFLTASGTSYATGWINSEPLNPPGAYIFTIILDGKSSLFIESTDVTQLRIGDYNDNAPFENGFLRKGTKNVIYGGTYGTEGKVDIHDGGFFEKGNLSDSQAVEIKSRFTEPTEEYIVHYYPTTAGLSGDPANVRAISFLREDPILYYPVGIDPAKLLFQIDIDGSNLYEYSTLLADEINYDAQFEHKCWPDLITYVP